MKTKMLISFASIFVSLAALATPSGRYFDRVIFVMFENGNYSNAMSQPFFERLATEGANLSNLHALTHPSQPNYIAITSGARNGIWSNRTVTLNAKNIVDLLEAKGLTWRVYAEDYPGNCSTVAWNEGYARKHNPFISYLNIQSNPKRCANIVNSAQFEIDAQSNSLPNYVFYIPNETHNGHNSGLTVADAWYAQTFSKYLTNSQFMEKTVLITTFDESGINLRNHIYTSIYSPLVKPGVYGWKLSLTSLLKLVEDNWALGNFGMKDLKANPVPNIWK